MKSHADQNRVTGSRGQAEIGEGDLTSHTGVRRRQAPRFLGWVKKHFIKLSTEIRHKRRRHPRRGRFGHVEFGVSVGWWMRDGVEKVYQNQTLDKKEAPAWLSWRLWRAWKDHPCVQTLTSHKILCLVVGRGSGDGARLLCSLLRPKMLSLREVTIYLFPPTNPGWSDNSSLQRTHF